ncbi:MAG: glycoside hydrolase [Dactylosporangium sp.]|nr:C40 family peptidase [Dactylosporangium sp.]NNJ63199.1 glycoside hydrolase [Dactylosporangium sp.]
MRVPRTLLRALVVGASVVATLIPAHAASADPTPAQVEAQIEQAHNELEDVIEAYNGIGEELKTTQAAAADVAARIETLTEQLAEAQRDVQTVAGAVLRRSGDLNTLSVILSAGSADGFLDQVATLKHVSRAQQRDVNRYQELKTKLGKEQNRYADLIDQQAAQQRQAADRRTKIESDIRSLEALKVRLNAPPPAPPPTTTPTAPAVSGAAGKAVSFAYAQLNKPYVWGAAGPDGYDCSGLVMASWAAAGVSLPRTVAQQWTKVTEIERGSLKPGDLVFYRSLGHVAIYVGSGNVIHAPHTGDVVKVASVDMMTPYGYGRPG